MAKSTTRSRIQERQNKRRKKAQTQLIIVVAVGALAVVGLLIALTSRPASTAVAISEFDFEGLTQETMRTNGGLGFAVGNPDAPVTLVEYSDFSCPHCYDLNGIIHQLIDTYGRDGDLRIVFKPIGFVNPDYSRPAAQAAICAGQQGRFWQMHDQIWMLYEQSSPRAYTNSLLTARAAEIGLDTDEFASCFNAAGAEVDAILAEANRLGINSTPTIFINDSPAVYRGADTGFADLSAAIEAELE